MVKISRTFLASAKNISEKSTNRTMVYEAMKRSMQLSMEHKHSIYIKNLYLKLSKRKVGTTTVEALCGRICSRLPKRRKGTLVNLIIRWKLTDAYDILRRAKYENTQEWRRSKQIIDEGNILAAYERLWNRETRKYENNLDKQLKHKLQFLETKYRKSTTIPENIGEIIIKDQDIPNEYESSPRIYGGVTMNDAEASLLSLPPKYAIYEKVNEQKCEAEIEKALAKLRWETKTEKEDRPAVNMELFNATEKTFDFTKFKSTDLPFNSRVTLPHALDDETEINMQQLKNKLKECTSRYVQNNEFQRNLTEEQEIGLTSLIKRRNNQEIIVFETDKTKRFSCDSAENYRTSAEPHIRGDETITEETKKEYERQLNAHTEMWLRILNAGKDVNNHDRIRYSMKSKNCPPAPLTIPRKDHKAYESEHIGPPGRPLCSGDVSYNMRLSYLMSIILGEIYKEEETVCSSTEELIAEIDKINSEGIDSSYIIGSADVDALYPSLDINFTIDKICEMFLNSEVKYKRINYKEISLYIAINKTQAQIDTMGMQHVCPKRKNKRGPRPNLTGCGTTIEDTNRYNPWIFPDLTHIDVVEQRKMMAEAIKIVLHAILETHTYSFDNQIKRQTTGGPIGMQLTGEVAQIFMTWWDKQVKELCRDKGIEIKLYARYVDDINAVIKKVEPGSRFIESELVITDAAKTEDSQYQHDKITMTIFKDVAESIHNSIKLKVDYPSEHEDHKIPILDLKVWIEETEDGTKIMYEHYEKEIASKSVIHAKSAMQTQMKRTILTQEMLRILTHCSPSLQWNKVCEHVNQFMRKLQFSGYDQKFRYSIADSALKAFETIKQKATTGERPINRPRNWKRQERRLESRKKKKEWYKRGGFESVLFVPPTPGSKLKKLYSERIMGSGLRIKVVEKTGKKLKHLIQKTAPFKQERCAKEDCFPCDSGSKGDCLKESITYKIECGDEACTGKNIYNGETSYNGYTRGKEHIDDLRRKNPRCALWRHCLEIHEGEMKQFTMKIGEHFRNDAMLRQITEAVKINNTPTDNVMNTRSEWNMPRVPHAQII